MKPLLLILLKTILSVLMAFATARALSFIVLLNKKSISLTANSLTLLLAAFILALIHFRD